MKKIFKKKVALLVALMMVAMLIVPVQVHAYDVYGNYALALTPPPVIGDGINTPNLIHANTNVPDKDVPWTVSNAKWFNYEGAAATGTFEEGKTYTLEFNLSFKDRVPDWIWKSATITVNNQLATVKDGLDTRTVTMQSSFMPFEAPEGFVFTPASTTPVETPAQAQARIANEAAANAARQATAIGAALQKTIQSGQAPALDVSGTKGCVWVSNRIWESISDESETIVAPLTLVYYHKGQKKTFVIPAGTSLDQLRDESGRIGGFEYIASVLKVAPQILEEEN